MPAQEYIKHLYEVEEASISEIAERTGVAWRTAAKYAQKVDWNDDRKSQRKRPVMDAVAEIVDTWLLEDRLLSRKERRDAAGIYRGLVKECQFTGSERTVRAYVSQRKRELFKKEQVPFVQLAQTPGEGQVDFGVAHAVRDGKVMELQVLILSFPHSNAGFAFPLPGQNRECFLEGLKRLFERMGGVPQRLRFDNLSAAVVSVGQGEAREVHETFRRFALHYRFEAEFCGAAKGHEKGHVENKVGYVRRHWLCPLQAFTGYEEMAQQLWTESLADMDRSHFAKGELISKLWKEDRKALRALPRIPFDVEKLERATLNNYAQFRFQNYIYEVPRGKPGMPVLLRVFWDRIEVRDSQQRLLTSLQRQYMLKEEELDWAAYFEIYARRPRAVTQAARFVHLPESVQRFFKEASNKTRSSRVRLVRDLLQKHPMSRLSQVLEELPATSCDDRASLELKLYMLDPENTPPAPLVEHHTPPQLRGQQTEITRYDRLTPGRGRGETDEYNVAQSAVQGAQTG